MTKEEMNKKTSEKIKAIGMLCKQLEISVTAEQMVTENGLIKNVIYYSDLEKYEPEEIKEIKQDDKKIAPIRK